MVASGAQADPLQDALMSTYNTNPVIKAERERLASVDETLSQAVAGFRPSAQVSGAYGRGRSGPVTTGGLFTPAVTQDWVYHDVNQKQFVIDQPLFNGFGTVAGIKSADNLVHSERAHLDAVEQDTLLQAVTAYMDVVESQSVRDLSLNNVEVLRKQLQATRDRFDYGEVTRTDVAQSEARLSRALADAATADATLEARRASFERTVGYKPGDLPFPSQQPPVPANLDEALAMAMDHNPNIVSLLYRQRSAESDVGVQLASLLPVVSLRGTVSRDENAGINGLTQFNSDSIALNFRVPLYQSGAEYSRVRDAKNISQARKFDLIDAQNQIRQNVVSAWEAYETGKSSIESNESAVKAAEIALAGVTQEQQYGSRTVLDVLDAEQELFSARVNLVRAKRDQLVASYNLLDTVGRLTAREMQLPVAVYDDKVHYKDVKYKFFGF